MASPLPSEVVEFSEGSRGFEKSGDRAELTYFEWPSGKPGITIWVRTHKMMGCRTTESMPASEVQKISQQFEKSIESGSGTYPFSHAYYFLQGLKSRSNLVGTIDTLDPGSQTKSEQPPELRWINPRTFEEIELPRVDQLSKMREQVAQRLHRGVVKTVRLAAEAAGIEVVSACYRQNEIVIRHRSLVSPDESKALCEKFSTMSALTVRLEEASRKKSPEDSLIQTVRLNLPCPATVKFGLKKDLAIVTVRASEGDLDRIRATLDRIEEKTGFGIFLEVNQVRQSTEKFLTTVADRDGIVRDPNAMRPILRAGVRTPVQGVFTPSVESGRVDRREVLNLSVDPRGSWDLDDVVRAVKLSGGRYLLEVDIPDVPALVPYLSADDRSSYEKGFSVYGKRRDIPMFPRKSAYGKLSLLPNQDRLTWTVSLIVDSHGEIESSQIYRSVIRSKFKLDYATASELTHSLTHPAAETLRNLREVATLLSNRRLELNGNGKSNGNGVASYEMVAECMLAANRALGQFLKDAGLPALYRAHVEPSPEKRQGIVEKVNRLGIELSPEQIEDPRIFRRTLAQIQKLVGPTGFHQFFNQYVGRAFYTPQPIEHYALGYDVYVHGTSPIRRAVDVINWRLVELVKYPDKKNEALLRRDSESEAAHLNRKEEESELQAGDLVYIERLDQFQKLIGKITKAVISEVSPMGVYAKHRRSGQPILIERDPRFFLETDETNAGWKMVDRGGNQYRPGKPVVIQYVGTSLREDKPVAIIQEVKP